MSRGAVVVVGGTGAVGREVVDLLARRGDEVVVVARDGERVAAVADDATRRHGARVTARAADIGVPAGRVAALAGAEVVVTCIERSNVDVARAALGVGAHVVDVSASADILTRLEGLDALARRHDRAVALSVGLAPGLTNLLARACLDPLPDASSVEVTVLLGLGEHHGADAVRWTLDGLAADPGTPRPAPARVRLPGFGHRTAHPFPFSDQHTLRRTLEIPVTTRLCFDSRLATAAAFGLRPVVRRLPRQAVAGALGRIHLGSDRFAVVVTATAADGRRVAASATGRRQAHATAVVVAHTVGRLRAGAIGPGAHHLDQALDIETALAAAETAGLTVHRPELDDQGTDTGPP